LQLHDSKTVLCIQMSTLQSLSQTHAKSNVYSIRLSEERERERSPGKCIEYARRPPLISSVFLLHGFIFVVVFLFFLSVFCSVFVTQIYFYRCLVHSEVKLKRPIWGRIMFFRGGVGREGRGGALGKTVRCVQSQCSPCCPDIRRLYFSQTPSAVPFSMQYKQGQDTHDAVVVSDTHTERATLYDDHCIGIRNR